MNQRVTITDAQIEKGVQAAVARITNNIARHGRGSFISKAEIYGMLEDELKEYRDAMHGPAEALEHELLDIAAGAIFAVASLRANTQWRMDEFNRIAEERQKQAKAALDAKMTQTQSHGNQDSEFPMGGQ